MNQIEEIINEYDSYLIKFKPNLNKIKINSIDDINSYMNIAKNSLDKLEEMSKEYKLYDNNYEEFMINMGMFAISLKELDDVNLKDNKDIKETFIILNTKFEELQRKNIMKDAYVWK